MKKERNLEQIFRGYGEEFFGKTIMDQITTEQIEEGRCAAMNKLHDLTEKYGRQEDGTAQVLFCEYIFNRWVLPQLH